MKIFRYLLTGILVIQLTGCSVQATVDPVGAEMICSICDGKGYVIQKDMMFWPNITYNTFRCTYCHGKGYVYEPYFYTEAGMVIYNHPRRIITPRRHFPPRKHPIDNRHHPSKAPMPKPSPRIESERGRRPEVKPDVKPAPRTNRQPDVPVRNSNQHRKHG